MTDEDILKEVRRGICVESEEIKKISEKIDEKSVLLTAKTLQNCKGKVILSGCGTSGMAAKKIAHSLCCIEIPALFLSPADAVHGGFGVLQKEDIVILISKGGNTAELTSFIPVCKAKGCLLIGVSEDPLSEIGKNSDIYLKVAVDKEICKFNMLATSSTLAVIALFDSICVALMQMTAYTKEQFALVHPGGAVGDRLLNNLK